MNLDLNALGALADAHLPGALFVTVSGSHLYGFSSLDSDVDLRDVTPRVLHVQLRPIVNLSD